MRAIVERYGTAMVGAALVLLFVLAAPNFASPQNLLNIGKETSFLAIMALGFTLALTVGELDLSVAEVASLAAVAAGFTIQRTGSPALAVAAGLGVGLLGGLANGVAVTVLKVPSLIATLGTGAIARGLAFWITGGVAFIGRWPTGFTGLARGQVGGVPYLLLWMAAVAAASWLLVGGTWPGAHMVATGEATESARLAGVRTGRMRRLGLALSGLLAGAAAVLLAASLSSAAPAMASDYFLYAIAAVLLGMTMFQPGRPNVPGTLVASVVLKVLGNGLVLMGAAYYVQDIVLGAIIVGAVAVSASTGRQAFR